MHDEPIVRREGDNAISVESVGGSSMPVLYLTRHFFINSRDNSFDSVSLARGTVFSQSVGHNFEIITTPPLTLQPTFATLACHKVPGCAAATWGGGSSAVARHVGRGKAAECCTLWRGQCRSRHRGHPIRCCCKYQGRSSPLNNFKSSVQGTNLRSERDLC